LIVVDVGDDWEIPNAGRIRRKGYAKDAKETAKFGFLLKALYSFNSSGAMMELTINGKAQKLDDAQTGGGTMPLLWVLRDVLNMTGTKFGCGVAACGACTVRVDGQAMRSCVTPVSSVVGKQVQTIEGLGADKLHAVQQAWIAEQVPQCGYCQSGMLMAAATLLEAYPAPTDAQIDEAMTNICRCGTYQRVRAGIHRASRMLKGVPA
jgi:isoquinoline 1-oxidoreductase subunit alpha